MAEPSKYAIDLSARPSRYAIDTSVKPTRDLTEAERAYSSLKRGADRAEELQVELKRLRRQTVQQQQWLDDPANPPDDTWFQRKVIWDDNWTAFEQTVGNLVGWVAIHLAEASRVPEGDGRDRIRGFVERLYAIEGWLEQSGARELRQHPNQEEVPF